MTAKRPYSVFNLTRSFQCNKVHRLWGASESKFWTKMASENCMLLGSPIRPCRQDLIFLLQQEVIAQSTSDLWHRRWITVSSRWLARCTPIDCARQSEVQESSQQLLHRSPGLRGISPLHWQNCQWTHLNSWRITLKRKGVITKWYDWFCLL